MLNMFTAVHKFIDVTHESNSDSERFEERLIFLNHTGLISGCTFKWLWREGRVFLFRNSSVTQGEGWGVGVKRTVRFRKVRTARSRKSLEMGFIVLSVSRCVGRLFRGLVWKTSHLSLRRNAEGDPSAVNVFQLCEAHLRLSGSVDKRNVRHWTDKNPKRVHEEGPLHSPWCAISEFGVIGPYFFEENGRFVTDNVQRLFPCKNIFLNFAWKHLMIKKIQEKSRFNRSGLQSILLEFH